MTDLEFAANDQAAEAQAREPDGAAGLSEAPSSATDALTASIAALSIPAELPETPADRGEGLLQSALGEELSDLRASADAYLSLAEQSLFAGAEPGEAAVAYIDAAIGCLRKLSQLCADAGQAETTEAEPTEAQPLAAAG